jgi:hypothetical protein
MNVKKLNLYDEMNILFYEQHIVSTCWDRLKSLYPNLYLVCSSDANETAHLQQNVSCVLSEEMLGCYLMSCGALTQSPTPDQLSRIFDRKLKTPPAKAYANISNWMNFKFSFNNYTWE